MENDKLLDHEYDGIKELDNPLPRWWLATFYATIVFSVFYVGYYNYGSGPSSQEELTADLAAIQAAKNVGGAKGPNEDELNAVFQDTERRKAGATIFHDKCISCHGVSGQGGIGPNLVDKFWLHGNGSLIDIFTVVSDGVPDKGMPPWAALLKGPELESVVAFLKSLQGTHPANPKPPQGEEVK